ncbi:MAG: hypothetical protein ACOX2Y_00305 [Christensenellales bacterium]|nr:hypothetical protein [Clostridiales bacterium]
MNKNIHNNELTFQSIFALIKRSFVRIVIFVLVTAVLTGGVGAIIIFAIKEPQNYQAMIQFNYAGVEDGLDPWGRKLDVSKIKADNIISEALIENNFSEKERAELRDKIKNNITIAGVVPDDIMEQILIIKEIATKNPQQLNELKNLKYYSTSYVVCLNSDELDLSHSQYIDILNSIVDNYIVEFKEKYGHGDVLGTLIAEEVDFSTYDYVEIYDVFNTQVQDIIRYLNFLVDSSGSFRTTSTKLSFADLRSRVNAIKNYNLKSLETYIFEYGIASENSLIGVEVYIQEKLERIDIQIAATENLINNTKQAMEDFRDFYNTRRDVLGNEEQYLANGDIYQMYANDLVKYQKELVQYQTDKELWEKRLEKFQAFVDQEENDQSDHTKAEMIDYADAMIENISTALKSEIDRINDAVQEYMETEVLKNSIMKTVSAVRVFEDKDNIKTLAIAVIIASFLAFLAALIVTNIKEKKASIIGVKDEAESVEKPIKQASKEQKQ